MTSLSVRRHSHIFTLWHIFYCNVETNHFPIPKDPQVNLQFFWRGHKHLHYGLALTRPSSSSFEFFAASKVSHTLLRLTPKNSGGTNFPIFSVRIFIRRNSAKSEIFSVRNFWFLELF